MPKPVTTELYQVTSPYFCAGADAINGTITQAAPILIAGIRLAANITTYACPTGCQSPERGASQDCGACRALIALEVAWDLINRKTDTRQRRTNQPPQLDLTNVCVRCWSRPGKRAWFGQLT